MFKISIWVVWQMLNANKLYTLKLPQHQERLSWRTFIGALFVRSKTASLTPYWPIDSLFTITSARGCDSSVYVNINVDMNTP